MNRHLSARSVAVIRIAALLLAAAWLTGCGILPKQETLALYRPAPAIAVDGAWPQANWQVQDARGGAFDAGPENDTLGGGVARGDRVGENCLVDDGGAGGGGSAAVVVVRAADGSHQAADRNQRGVKKTSSIHGDLRR